MRLRLKKNSLKFKQFESKNEMTHSPLNKQVS